ncbi:amino acid ABC transporter permease [Denitromonas iodatirespirans]|uniref:Amino acid ABC transporter permease n=1 Tax=Denitromonas iodatirespirans TaxID=2795389 RepID=A0A944D8Y4_DENI1|nr:amino acid ABC transporter permease [Denitromonas iodatirespirans]MBT0960092.1 amino acid ABC transporter permease [Denitromonas iodatirespirans]
MADETSERDIPAKPRRLTDPKFRALVFQILASITVAAFLFFIVRNTLHNMELRGISTGFGFLDRVSGFGILQSLIEYDESSTYGRTFLVGLLNTLLVSALGVFFATLIGFVMGVLRLSSNWLINKLATVYIETFRNIPLLLQIFFWYFAIGFNLPSPRQSITVGESLFLNNRGLYLPAPVFEDGFMATGLAIVGSIIAVIFLARWARKRFEATGQLFHTVYASLAILIGVPTLVYVATGMPMHLDYPTLQGFNFKGGLTVIPELFALTLALSIYTGAFIAETVRSGIQSVSHGQTEAASALGLRPSWTLRLVVIPQAMRVIIPPLTSQYLNLTKNSSLAAAIGYPDLVAVFAGTTLNQTGQAVEVIAITMSVYLVLSLVISVFMNWYNAKMALRER